MHMQAVIKRVHCICPAPAICTAPTAISQKPQTGGLVMCVALKAACAVHAVPRWTNQRRGARLMKMARIQKHPVFLTTVTAEEE